MPPTEAQHLSPAVHDALPVHAAGVAASGRFTGPASRPGTVALLLPTAADELVAMPLLPVGQVGPLAQAKLVTPPAVVWQHTSDDVHSAAPQITAGPLTVLPLPLPFPPWMPPPSPLSELSPLLQATTKSSTNADISAFMTILPETLSRISRSACWCAHFGDRA